MDPRFQRPPASKDQFDRAGVSSPGLVETAGLSSATSYGAVHWGAGESKAGDFSSGFGWELALFRQQMGIGVGQSNQ